MRRRPDRDNRAEAGRTNMSLGENLRGKKLYKMVVQSGIMDVKFATRPPTCADKPTRWAPTPTRGFRRSFDTCVKVKGSDYSMFHEASEFTHVGHDCVSSFTHLQLGMFDRIRRVVLFRPDYVDASLEEKAVLERMHISQRSVSNSCFARVVRQKVTSGRKMDHAR